MKVLLRQKYQPKEM